MFQKITDKAVLGAVALMFQVAVAILRQIRRA